MAEATAGGAPFVDRVRAALAMSPGLRLPDHECDRRAAVTLLLAPVEESDASGVVPERQASPSRTAALFVHRARVEGDPWSGHVALPGGGHDPDDRDILDTALRETREETGIVLRPRDVLGRLHDLHPRSAHLPSIGITPFVAWLPVRPGVNLNHELVGHLWVPVSELAAPARRSSLIRTRPRPRRFPTIEFNGAVIWGLTFAIVEEFLARLGLRPDGPPPGGVPHK